MKRKGNLYILIVLLIIVSVLLLGSFNSVIALEDNVVDDSEFKTIRVGLTDPIPTLDPVDHVQRNAQTVIRNFTDGLKQTMPDGSHVLEVAESITELDPLTYEIKIREGITFHNGDLLTADDIVFSYERFMNSVRKSLLPIDSVEKIDDFTIIAKLEKYNAVLPRRWYMWEMMPKKYFEEVGVEGFIKHPIGCGPFKYVSGTISTELVLERYDDYYGGAPELPGDVDRIPAVDRVIFKFIPENTTRVAALLAGDVDIIQHVPFDSIELLQKESNIEVKTAEGNVMVTLWFNVKNTPLNDVRIRKAIAHAIDYESIVKFQLLGYATILGGRPFLEPFSDSPGFGQFEAIQPFEYSPKKAKAYLEEAGAIDPTFVLDTTSEFTEVAQAIAQMLADIGLNVTVREWEYGAIHDATISGQRNAFLRGVGNAQRNEEWINRITTGGVTSNYVFWDNPTFDNLIEKGRATPPSPERYAFFTEAFELVMDEVPIITLYAPNIVEACSSTIKNFYPSHDGRVNLHRVDID